MGETGIMFLSSEDEAVVHQGFEKLFQGQRISLIVCHVCHPTPSSETSHSRATYAQTPRLSWGQTAPGDDAEGQLFFSLKSEKATQISKNALPPNPR